MTFEEGTQRVDTETKTYSSVQNCTYRCGRRNYYNCNGRQVSITKQTPYHKMAKVVIRRKNKVIATLEGMDPTPLSMSTALSSVGSCR